MAIKSDWVHVQGFSFVTIANLALTVKKGWRYLANCLFLAVMQLHPATCKQLLCRHINSISLNFTLDNHILDLSLSPKLCKKCILKRN